jgi:hypothetical protein
MSREFNDTLAKLINMPEAERVLPSGKPQMSCERTVQDALALAEITKKVIQEGVEPDIETVDEYLVLLADEVKRLRDREARTKPILLRYDEIAEPFAEVVGLGENRVEALANGILDMRAEIKRLRKELAWIKDGQPRSVCPHVPSHEDCEYPLTVVDEFHDHSDSPESKLDGAS